MKTRTIARTALPEERQRWNHFVASSPHGHISQSFEWGLFRAGEGWRPHWIALEEGDALEGAALLLEKPLRGLGRSVFLVPRGPIVDYADGEKVSTLCRAMETTVVQHGGLFLRINPEIRADAERPPSFSDLVRAKSELQHRCTFRLSLHPDLEEIRRRMEGRTRYAISRGLKRGVEVTSGCTETDVAHFHALLRETAARQAFRIQAESFFQNLVRTLGPEGRVRIFLARHRDRVVSGAVVLLFGPKSWYTWGGSSIAGREANPNELLHWEIIRWLKERGIEYYDLHGVACDPRPEDRTWGVYLFKRGFGGERVEWMGEWDRVLSPLGHRAWCLLWPGYLGLSSRVARLAGLVRRESGGRS